MNDKPDVVLDYATALRLERFLNDPEGQSPFERVLLRGRVLIACILATRRQAAARREATDRHPLYSGPIGTKIEP